MTSLPEDGERRPMSLRQGTALSEDGERRPMSLGQDSYEPPAGGGLSAQPQSFSCGRTECKSTVNVTICLYNMGPHHRGARIQDADVMPLCVLASSDRQRRTISTKPFSCPYQLVFRCEHCLVLTQSPHQKSVVIAFPPRANSHFS